MCREESAAELRTTSRVEECAQIQQATPTKYICDGKQYTSVQLSDIRNGQTATAK